MSRRTSFSSADADSEGELDGTVIPDGGRRMANPYDSVAMGGIRSRLADETIRASASTSSAMAGGTIQTGRGPAPHQAQTNQPQAADLSSDQRDFLAAKLQLEQAKLISQTATSINHRWTTEKKLAADGNNLAQWLRELQEAGSTHMSNGDFFFKAIPNSTFEKIARMVVLAGVHSSLVPDVQRIGTTLEIVAFLRRKFSVISRAAQMNIFNKFLNFSVEDSDSAGLSSGMRNLYTDWNNVNVRINSDAFFGFVFQAAVMQSSVPFKKDFKQRIKNLMQNNPSKALPKFDLLVNNFDICKRQFSDRVASQTSINDPTAAPSVLLTLTESGGFDFDDFLADVPEENWPEALDFYAMTAHRCWQCGAADHYLRDCPQRAKSNQINRRVRGPGVSPFQQPAMRTQATFVGSLYTQPSTTANNNAVPRSTAPPTHTQVQAKRLADLYRPRYPNRSPRQNHSGGSTQQTPVSDGGATAQFLEIGDLPDDLDELDFKNMSLGEDILPPPTNPISLESEISTLE